MITTLIFRAINLSLELVYIAVATGQTGQWSVVSGHWSDRSVVSGHWSVSFEMWTRVGVSRWGLFFRQQVRRASATSRIGVIGAPFEKGQVSDTQNSIAVILITHKAAEGFK